MCQLQQRVRAGSGWDVRLRTAEGECQRVAGAAAVKAGEYEKGLEHHLRATDLLGLNEAEVRAADVPPRFDGDLQHRQ